VFWDFFVDLRVIEGYSWAVAALTHMNEQLGDTCYASSWNFMCSLLRDDNICMIPDNDSNVEQLLHVMLFRFDCKPPSRE